MRRFVLATLAALAIGTAAFAQPAEARCWWNGYSWHCWHPHGWWGYHHPYWRHYGYGYGPYWYHHRYCIPDQCSGLEHRRAGGGSGDLAEHRA